MLGHRPTIILSELFIIICNHFGGGRGCKQSRCESDMCMNKAISHVNVCGFVDTCMKTQHAMYQERKSSLNIKFLGRIFLGHPGPRRRDIPNKNFMQVAFFCCFRKGVAGMSPDLGRDVPDLEKLYAGKLWADLSYPNVDLHNHNSGVTRHLRFPSGPEETD